MRVASVFIATVMFLSPALAIAQEPGLPAEIRDWVSADGNHTTTAKLVGFVDRGVELRKADDKTVKVPLSKLSKADQEFARAQFRAWGERATIGVAFVELAAFKEVLIADDRYKTDPEWKALVKSYPSQPCVVVQRVESAGPAASSGLKAGDLVTHINGAVVRDQTAMLDAFMGIPPGAECEVKLLRRVAKPKGVAWAADSVRITTATADQFASAKRELAKAEALAGPLRLSGGTMIENAIGIPVVVVDVKNVSDSDCIAYTIDVECFNNFDEKVVDLRGSNVFHGISQERLKAGATDRAKWTLNLHDNTTRAVVRVVRVRLANGTEWNANDGKPEALVVRAKD